MSELINLDNATYEELSAFLLKNGYELRVCTIIEHCPESDGGNMIFFTDLCELSKMGQVRQELCWVDSTDNWCYNEVSHMADLIDNEFEEDVE